MIKNLYSIHIKGTHLEMKEFLSEIHNIDDNILEDYISNWHEYSLPRKTIITAPGNTEYYRYFALEGVQKAYYLNRNKEHIISFSNAPSFSGIPESFFTQTPSKYFLETITASEFLRITKTEHERLMGEHREIETLFRKSTELYLIGVLERYHELMALDIENRFKSFAKKSPHLLGIVTNKDIASYLRIDPTNFSKLLNNVPM